MEDGKPVPYIVGRGLAPADKPGTVMVPGLYLITGDTLDSRW